MAPAAAWLLLDTPSGRHLALPVPRRALPGLTRAVSFLLRRLTTERSVDGSDPGAVADWFDGCWQAAAQDPAVAVWMIAESRRGSTATFRAGQSVGEERVSRWITRLRQCLVLPTSPQAVGQLRSATRVSETRWSQFAGVGDGAGTRTERPVTAELAGRWLEDLDRSARAEPVVEVLDKAAPSAWFDAESPADEQVLALDDVLLTAGSISSFLQGYDGRVATARLDAIRELAYGAGHEINNPLANIAARAQALLLDETDSERRRRLATIVDQAFRARDMIGGLMIFARPPRPSVQREEIAAVLMAVTDSLRETAEQHGVRLALNLPLESVSVEIDRGQIEDALRQVALNAIESIAGGGTVGVEAASAPVTAEAACVVTITDNGIGMSQETVERMFDPFFSGREAGRGVGLGLSKALRLIDANGGAIAVDSRPRQGTTVSIRLPAAP